MDYIATSALLQYGSCTCPVIVPQVDLLACLHIVLEPPLTELNNLYAQARAPISVATECYHEAIKDIKRVGIWQPLQKCPWCIASVRDGT